MSHLSAAQAENYYEKDDYYAHSETEADSPSSGQWYGQGAAALGLSGAVETDAFRSLLHGIDPHGNSLHARPIDPTNHRAATDYTFSAPKSVSIAGLIQQDKRVLQAHDQAVTVALSVMEERYAQTRISTPQGRQRVGTGNLIVAIFRHETSREQDPQLHSHCVVINATQLADNSWRSLSNEQIVANQKLLGEIYQNELAFQLRELGYDINPQQQGQFELQRYPPDLLKTFSTRTRQIEDYIEQWQESLQLAGGTPLHAEQKKQATLNTRRSKQTVPRDVLVAGWNHVIEQKQFQLPAVPEAGRDLSESRLLQATVAARDGIAHASEREAVFRRSKVERFALEHHLGQSRFHDLQQALHSTNELIEADPLKDKYTTQSAIQRELETIRLMQQAKGTVQPIASVEKTTQFLAQSPTLTVGQQQAILLAAGTPDRILAWQGVAGAGKTCSLQLYKTLAEAEGFTVRGFAPSAEAASVLGKEVCIPADTVASLLHSSPSNSPHSHIGQEIWIVDEAGLLSAKDACVLLQKAEVEQARVILVGDTRQLSAVEAGNPFKSLQAGGIAIAYLEESLRQKAQDLNGAVAAMAQGDVTQSLQRLDHSGMIQQIPDSHERLNQVAYDYLALTPQQREGTLLLTGTHAERLALTTRIRQALQEEGQLGADALTLTSLRAKDLTTAQAQYIDSYAPGDVIVPTQAYKRQGLEKNQQYTVVAVDGEDKCLTLQSPTGELLTVNPAHCEQIRVYDVQQIPIAAGDRLKWTRNDRETGRRNGQMVTVEAIDPDGTAQLVDRDGQKTTVHLGGQQYIDHALASTTYSSQGKTAERVMAVLDHTTTQQSFYVSISRAKHHLTVYTADKAELFRLAQTSKAKENASDYIPLFQLGHHHGKTQKETTHPSYSPHHSRDIGKRLGERIGERLSQRLATSIRGDQHIEAAKPGTPTAGREAQQTPGFHPGELEQVLPGLPPLFEWAEHTANSDLETVGRMVDTLRDQIDGERIESLAATLRVFGDIAQSVESTVKSRRQTAAATSEYTAAISGLVAAVDQAIVKQQIPKAPKSPAVDPPTVQGQGGSHRPVSPHQGKPSSPQEVWQFYRQKVQETQPVWVETLVGLKILEDGYTTEDLASMMLAGSEEVQRLKQECSMQQLETRTISKANYLGQVVRAISEIETAPPAELERYRTLYVQQSKKVERSNVGEQDVRIVSALIPQNSSDVKEAVKTLYQSPHLQSVKNNRESFQRYIIEVLKVVLERKRQLSQPQTDKKKGGLELD